MRLYLLICMVVRAIANIYVFLILLYCIFSWIPQKRGLFAQIDLAIARLVEPYLNLFRRFIPPFGGIDFSPVIAILVLELIVGLLF